VTTPSFDDERAIQRLLAEYCHLCDDGDFDALVDRFTPDGSFVMGDRVASGREALLRWFERRQPPERRGKHAMTNVIIEVQGDHADVRSDYVFLAFVDGALTPLMAGRYRDELHCADGSWRFARREATALEPPSS
jgi:uncharacterized protein (TIGR02246 family)